MADRVVVDRIDFRQALVFPRVVGSVVGALQPSRILLGTFALLCLIAIRRVHDAVRGPTVQPSGLLAPARTAIDAYVGHFNPTFLFTSGDAQPRHHGSDTGQLYLWDALPILAGIATILHRRRSPAHAAVGLWLLVGPAPASLATEAPHAVRTIVMLPAWYLVGAIGATALWRRVSHTARRATSAAAEATGATMFHRAGPALAIAYAAMVIPTAAYYADASRRYYPIEYPSY